MWRRFLMLLVMVAAAVTLPVAGGPVAAQGGEECPVFVARALSSLETYCGGLEREAACYGLNRVDSVFWEPRDDLVFNAPSDRVPLIDLRTISTAPLNLEQELWGVAVMHIQANLPDTLPGQAVTFLLMGDTTLENAVTPEEAAAAQAVEPVPATAIFPANLRSRPTTAANILTSVRPGAALTLIGVSEARDWYEVALEIGGTGWVFHELVMVEDEARLAALPVTYGPHAAPRYGPMQAFYFSTGLGGQACNEAPNALVVQSTELAQVTLRINELEVRLGSTVIFTTVTLPDGSRAMVIVLLEGRLRTFLNGVPIDLTAPGQTIAVTLNDQGLVDDNSRLVDLSGLDLGTVVWNACQAAVWSGIFGPSLPVTLCGPNLFFFRPPLPPRPTPSTTEEPSPPGEWGGCGSCADCGPYAQAECVLAPDGQCLWDPATCGYHPAGGATGGEAGAWLSVAYAYCSAWKFGAARVDYHSSDGASASGYSASISSSDVMINTSNRSGNAIGFDFYCGAPGTGADVTVTVGDTAGRTLSITFQVTNE